MTFWMSSDDDGNVGIWYGKKPEKNEHGEFEGDDIETAYIENIDYIPEEKFPSIMPGECFEVKIVRVKAEVTA